LWSVFICRDYRVKKYRGQVKKKDLLNRLLLFKLIRYRKLPEYKKTRPVLSR
jgi:hypothetical protein